MSATPRPRLGGALAYLWPITLIELVFTFAVVVLSALSLAMSIIGLGIPLLLVVLVAVRGLSDLDRRCLRWTLGVTIVRPYRPATTGSPLRRLRTRLADPATWRDWLYLVVRIPLGLFASILTLALWGYSIAVILLPVYTPWLGPTAKVEMPDIHLRIVVVRTSAQALPYAGIGMLVLILAILITPQLARFHAVVARGLLGPTKATARLAELTVTAQRLQASRARGVDAAEAERRRIERDLHDGAQQRLVSLAMTLGRAKTKLDNDPELARALLDEAHADAKLAVAELRDLARGIFPAVLGDRGLDAALSALAARSPVPVTVDVELATRPPAAVESTAYFIVAEALTNLAKHAQAQRAWVFVRRTGDAVGVVVGDDGQGGATARPGGGLAGLADRAATIDGTLTVTSPLGGPTEIRAELPCAW